LDRKLVFAQVTTSSVRTEVVDGRSWLVAPVVAIHAGVLNGELVPAADIRDSVPYWNDVPVPINHPMLGDQKLSARDIKVIERVGVGRFYGAYYDNESLKGELWIDIEKVNKLGGDAQIALEKLQAGETLEVSTAYFCDLSEETGTYGGVEYTAVQHNLRPDHLALLPKGIGACSWATGCGAPRVNKESEAMQLQVNLLPGESYQERMERIENAVKAMAVPLGQDGWWAYTSDLYDDRVVYRLGSPAGEEYYEAPYTVAADGTVSLGTPVKVERNVTYVPLRTQIRSTARTPSYSGTEKTSWTGPTLDKMIAGYVKNTGNAKPDSSLVKDLPAAVKTWIANRTLLGDAAAVDTANLIFFPCVNPSTNKLNENALRAVIGGRGAQADIPAAAKESAQAKARALLEKEFGMQIQEETIINRVLAKIRNALGGTTMSKREELIEALHVKGVKTSDEILENADEGLLQEMVDHYTSEPGVVPDVVPPAEGLVPPVVASAAPCPATNKLADTLTDNEKRELLALLKENKDREKAEKDGLIASLVANDKCAIEKDSLEKMDTAVLRSLSRAYEPGSYLGVGVPRGSTEAVPAPPAIVMATQKAVV